MKKCQMGKFQLITQSMLIKISFCIICGGQLWDKNPKKIDKPGEEIVPKKYHEHLSVFLKKEFKRMPSQKPWDYGIAEKVECVSLITIGADRGR